jgi:hypothetical protein
MDLNDYRGMSEDKLAEAVRTDYPGLSYVELRLVNSALAREINKQGLVKKFCELNFLTGDNRPRGFLERMSFSQVKEYVSKFFLGKRPVDIDQLDHTLANFLRCHEQNGKNYTQLLLEDGTLVPGSKSNVKKHSSRGWRHLDGNPKRKSKSKKPYSEQDFPGSSTLGSRHYFRR